MRTLIAAIVGGVVVFIWGYVAHVVLSLGDASIMKLKGEDSFMESVRSAAPEPGVYAFPFIAPDQMSDAAVKNAHDQKYMTGPNGLLVVGPNGEEPMGMHRMIRQIAASIIAAFFAAMLISGLGTGTGLVTKTVAGGALGLFAFTSQDLPNWIWWGFSRDFEMSRLIFTVVAWAAAGLVMSFVLKKPVKKAK